MAAGDVTQLLNRMAGESGEARKDTYDRLVTLVYQDLRRRAREIMFGEKGTGLQPTVLVHEAYERLLDYHMSFQDRQHFFNVAATAMRRFLIEQARRRRASKRGSGQPAADLEDSAAQSLDHDPDRLIDIDRALATLRPEQIQLAELRFFGGFTLEETASIMGLKAETVKKRWEVVKVLLFDKLEKRRAV